MTAVDYSTQTTLITGASAGIGAAFARELARRGSNLVLVARREDRLLALAAELTAQFGITAHAIAADLSVPGAGRSLAAETARRGIRVTSLVNNAGFGTASPFHHEDASRVTEEINVNVANLVDTSLAYINDLREAGNGVLINVSSVAGYSPIPGMAVYAATKAFVLSFTEAVWQESRPSGLRVISIAPGPTSTEFFDVVGENTSGGLRFQTPEQVVATTLRALDRRTPPPSVISGGINTALSSLGRFMSRRQVVQLAARIMAR